MKFGNWLNSKLYTEWKFYYIDYDKLKCMLKEVASRKGDLDEYDERDFVSALDKELLKVKIHNP
jgi:SPX domain protein involved in polyphosphate accumulation